jgi:hypothetical protein
MKGEGMIVFITGIFLGGVIGTILLSMCMIAKSSDRSHGKTSSGEHRGNLVTNGRDE